MPAAFAVSSCASSCVCGLGARDSMCPSGGSSRSSSCGGSARGVRYRPATVIALGVTPSPRRIRMVWCCHLVLFRSFLLGGACAAVSADSPRLVLRRGVSRLCSTALAPCRPASGRGAGSSSTFRAQLLGRILLSVCPAQSGQPRLICRGGVASAAEGNRVGKLLLQRAPAKCALSC